MLREIYIDKYNKIINNFKPELFNSLFITQSKPYNKEVELFQGKPFVIQLLISISKTINFTFRRNP